MIRLASPTLPYRPYLGLGFDPLGGRTHIYEIMSMNMNMSLDVNIPNH